MSYKYKDEPIVELSGKTKEELYKEIEELEIKIYGHILPKTPPEELLNRKRPQAMYSVERRCFVCLDTGEKRNDI